MADSNLQDRANQATIDLLNKLDRNSDVGVGFYVGFKDTVLEQLRLMLKNLDKEITTTLSKKMEQVSKEQIDEAQKQTNELKKTRDELSSKNGKLGKIIDTFADTAGMSQNITIGLQKATRVLGVAIDGITKGLEIAYKSSAEFADFATELRQSGVVLSEGNKEFKDVLTGVSNNLGLANETTVRVLKGSSEQMAKFGVTTGQNLTSVINDTMFTYKQYADISASNGEAIMKMQLDAMTRSMTTDEIINYNLRNNTELLTQRFRELSVATGKSVDMLVKEQQQKNSNLLVESWKNRNQTAYSYLAAFGIDKIQPLLEFITTGRQTAESAQYMADPAMRELIMTFRQYSATGQLNKLDTETAGAIFNPLAQAVQNTFAQRTKEFEQQGNLMGASQAFLNATFGGAFLEGRVLNTKAIEDLKNKNKDMEDLNIRANKDITIALDTMNNTIENLKALDSVKFKALSEATSFMSESMVKFGNKLNDWTPSGALPFLGGMAQSIGGEVLGRGIANLGGKIFNKIFAKDMVTKTLQSAFETGMPKTVPTPKTGFLGKIWNTTKNATKFAPKLLNYAKPVLKFAPIVSAAQHLYNAGEGIADIANHGFFGASDKWREDVKNDSIWSTAFNPLKWGFAAEQGTNYLLKKWFPKKQPEIIENKVVDQINEQGNKIIPETPKSKEQSVISENKQEQNDSVIEKPVPQTINLSEETLQEIKIILSGLAAGNSGILENISKTLNNQFDKTNTNNNINGTLVYGNYLK